MKLRSPIETVVGDRVPDLARRGSAWKARCPFHDEKTPSFVVNPERGTWRCFGACGEGGDAISFVQRFEGLTFYEALRVLAQASGVEMPARIESAHAREDEAAVARFEVLARAEKLYARFLRQDEGRAALAYARGRGLADDTLKAFGVGFAPRSGNPLCEAAVKAGFAAEALIEAGLARRSDDGALYDFFRGRLMIPIRDALGRTVGFGGRILPGDESNAKYVNTAETALFKKSRLIYALDRALPEVRRSKHLILMEGYTDVMAAHQVGVRNAAAVLGTATTEDHAALVRRSGARRVTLVFDGDAAGLRAGLKALEHLLPLGIRIDVAALSGGIDPCDLCVRDGAEGLQALVAGARDWFEHALSLLQGLSGPKLAEDIDEVLKLLLALPRPVEADVRVGEMARALGITEAAIREQAEALARRRRPARPTPGSRASGPAGRGAPSGPRAGGDGPSRPSRPASGGEPAPSPLARATAAAYEGLLGAALVDNSLIPGLRSRRPECPAGPLARIFDAILELWDGGDDEAPIDDAHVLTALGDDPARDVVVPLADRARTAESAQILARDSVAWLEKSAREREVERRMSELRALETPDLQDESTRDALRRLHDELRGIKVPNAPLAPRASGL